MAITVVGFDNADITEAGFARLMRYHGEVNNVHGVPSGLTASPGAGTRQVSVSSGIAVVPGALVESSAVETVTLDANPGSTTRTDYVVLEVDWVANAATVKKVTGSSGTPPALTQTEGGVWQMPLARVTVPAGFASAFTSARITVCKPVPRRQRLFTASPAAGSSTTNPDTISTLAIPDPGWPYRLEVKAEVRINANASARAVLAVADDAGVRVASRISPLLDDIQTLEAHDVSGIYTAPTTLTATIARSSGTGAVASNASGSFTVWQIPA